MSPCFASTTQCRLDRPTSQARSVRVHVYRRALHASGDAPWHSSAKHHILEACFFRMTPFRSMLLTVQSGLHHIPSNLVVDHWTSAVESSSPLDFLSLYAMWTPFGRLINYKIMSTISVACDFTTKSGRIWYCQRR